MPTISCQHCGKAIEVNVDLNQCPHCQNDISADVQATIVPESEKSGDEPDVQSSGDTAKTAVAGTALSPQNSLEIPPTGGSSRTIPSAGKSPNMADYSATLKPTDSAFDSIDLSSAIPPRAIATKESPGQAQDYRLGEKLGSGSFGVVYRATQVPLERTVALKMLKSRKEPSESESVETKSRIKSQRIKDRNEFLREAQFTGKLEHPNIVPVHDIGIVKGRDGKGNRPFYVMKEIKGESWMSRIKSNSRSENIEILRRVAEAIGYAHDKNIIHCDLKPENVMLGEFGEVLVVDWGGAVDLSRAETYRPGGSPAYISPEMARYWCDIFLDQKEASPSRRDIGKQSDVYLLGAMLFEIITGMPPHFGLKGEDAYDVMRRATQNEVRNHDKWMDDELMQIARRAIRLDSEDSYDTVTQFQDALKGYEAQRVSIELRERAEQLLAEAKENNDYDAFGKSRFGFEESIEKWEGNELSRAGLRDARLSCASLALNDQNFDLGIGMLENPETSDEKVVLKKLEDGKKKRDRRAMLVRALSIGMILAGIGSSVLIWYGVKSTQVAFEQTKIANEQKKIAKEQTKLATAETAKVDVLKGQQEKLNDEIEDSRTDVALEQFIANYQSQLAEDATARATDASKDAEASELEARYVAALASSEALRAAEAKKEAVIQTKEAGKQRKIALAEKQEALRQEKLAAEAEERNSLLSYKDRISQIRSSIVDGNFADAQQLLASADDDTKASWEWSRLNMLYHPESIEFLKRENDTTVTHMSATNDGSRFVIIDDQGSLTFHEASDFGRNLGQINIPGAVISAMAPSGRQVAIGIPGDGDADGRIEIYSGKRKITTIDAPSEAITDLKFSENGDRLLVIGRPNGSRASLGIEKTLMVFGRTGDAQNPIWNPIPVSLTNKSDGEQKGTQPKFTNGEFSKDGSQVLLTATDAGLAKVYDQTGKQEAPERRMHVYSEYEGKYQWGASNSSTNIDIAIFANDSGTQVVGCQTVDQVCELFSWNTSNASPSVQANPLGSEFVAAPVSSGSGEVQAIKRLGARINSMKRSGETLLTASGKELSLWNLDTQELIKTYKGHSRDIDFCTLAQNANSDKPILISVSAGENPEILKNDLSKYSDEVEVLAVGDRQNDENSPSSIFTSRKASDFVIGNDEGLAVVKRNGQTIEWEVGAWVKHYLTDDFVFAQSRRDEFFKYDRKTGEIVKILRRLSQKTGPKSPEIIKFQVSNDGRIGLIERSERDTQALDRKEFEIWDLETQTQIKSLRYDNLFTSQRDKNVLPTVALSPDGSYVVAGKLGFVVWSTQAGDDQPFFSKIGQNRGAEWPNVPINNILFIEGSDEFVVVGRKLRLRIKSKDKQTVPAGFIFTNNRIAMLSWLPDSAPISFKVDSTLTGEPTKRIHWTPKLLMTSDICSSMRLGKLICCD